MYACLWMLIAEQDTSKFFELQSLFVSYWEEKEHQFVAYYLKEYSNRTGIYICIGMQVTYILHTHAYYLGRYTYVQG